MLSIYRRHKSKCKYSAKSRKATLKRFLESNPTEKQLEKFTADLNAKSLGCECAYWITGTLFGQPYRRSAKTRNKEAAEKILRKLERGEEDRKPKPKRITIDHALQAFIRDCENRNLNRSTLDKYSHLRDLLTAFARQNHLVSLEEVDADRIRAYRQSRVLSPRTSAKELERIRAFFTFCVEADWLKKSPAKVIKAPQVRDNPTLPLSDAEVAKLMAHMEHRTQVFFRVLLQSGIRIIDAAQLTPQKIIDGKLFLYTQKTGTPVMLPLPPDLLHELSKLPLTGGFYFAVQSVAPVSIAERYRQKLNAAAIKAGLGKKKVKGTPRGKNIIHPHRFRDTFAVRLLEKGVPLETVSILLGHTDLRTTQRSYAPWVKSLQDNLEKSIQMTWSKPQLALVEEVSGALQPF